MAGPSGSDLSTPLVCLPACLPRLSPPTPPTPQPATRKQMKLSVVLGIIHMTWGILLRGANAIYFKQNVDLMFEFLPMIIFDLALFGCVGALFCGAMPACRGGQRRGAGWGCGQTRQRCTNQARLIPSPTPTTPHNTGTWWC